MIELDSTVNSINDTVNTIIDENAKRQRELEKLEMETSQNNVGD